jgi:hypothetical protein
MLLILFLLFLISFQMILCAQKKRRRRYENFFISSLTPVPPLTPTKISFLSPENLLPILTSKKDNFFQTFFDYDLLFARQSKTLEEYFEKIQRSVSFFSENEKNKIKKCSEECDKYLMSLGASFPGFDGVKASNIPWKFGRVQGKLYEYGLAHTRFNDLIIFSEDSLDKSDAQFTKTLIHEKIHLYQKQHPNDVQTYLSHNNIVKLKKREYNDYIRANPDLDDWIYKDEKTGFIFKCEYNSKFPKNILDVKNTNQLYEHPFEKMAVEISGRFKYQ